MASNMISPEIEELASDVARPAGETPVEAVRSGLDVILDASAIAAIVFQEPGCESLRDRLGAGDPVGVGTATRVEAGIVPSARLRRDARDLPARFLGEADARLIASDEDHWTAAADARLRRGTGRPPARLYGGEHVEVGR
jgi:uncharacterized protein with PIN domain